MTIRTSGSPNTPRTVSRARKPENEYPSDSRRCLSPVFAIPHHAKLARHFNSPKAPVFRTFRPFEPPESPTRFPEDPKFCWRRPRHTLKGRQLAAEVERIGLRLQLLRQQADAGDLVLLYGDESEALTHPYLARAWAKSGTDLRVPAPGQAKKVAILGSLDYSTGQLVVHTSKTKRSSDFVAHLDQLDRLYGPKSGQPTKPAVLVEDNGPIHTSKLSRAALAARAHWLTVEWLPKYALELNDIETVWRDLKAHHLAHQTFADADELDQGIRKAVEALNAQRMPVPLDKLRISA